MCNPESNIGLNSENKGFAQKEVALLGGKEMLKILALSLFQLIHPYRMIIIHLPSLCVAHRMISVNVTAFITY